MRELFPMFERSEGSAGADLPLYRDVKMDYRIGIPVFLAGEPVTVTGLEAVKSWAWRAVRTARYMYNVWSWEYGCELEALVGQPYSADTKLSEAVRYIREALEVCPYILSATGREARFDGSTLHMTVELRTVYGEVKIDV